jgi:hypothetical protein
MSILSKLLSGSPEPKMRDALSASRADVVTAAEIKLGRALSEEERRGIDGIESLMMLESCSQSFTSEKTTPRQVKEDLAYFGTKAKAK